jgi:NAD(P)-dependent dehydrogenase (short-subunit alcohol dehydrogenase family)
MPAQPATPTSFLTRPDEVLLRWGKRDVFTLGDAWEGVFVAGATGSGKSSGSGAHLARAYLKAGMGGLVLTAKKGEREQWEAYCRATHRSGDLRVVVPGGRYRFNFLDFELRRPGAGAGHTENLVHLFAEVLQLAERGSGNGGRDEEGYWRRACQQLMRNAIDLLVIATGGLSVAELYRLVVSAPADMEQMRSAEWRQTSFCFSCLRQADESHKSAQQEHDFEIVTDFFLIEWPQLSEKTRSVILSTFTSTIDVIHRGVLSQLFCADTTLTPEAIEEGAVVVIDLPVKEFGLVGQFAQVLWKSAFQRSIERRDMRQNARSVFLFADEAQYFITSPGDHQFQTTCRAARVATVLLTQSIGNLRAALGGSDQGEAETDSLLGNLNTKCLHANGDPVTNEWAASLIGRSRQFLVNASSQQQPQGLLAQWAGLRSLPATSAGISEQVDFEVQPKRFTTLRRGGPANGKLVDGIVFQGGKRFRANGKTWLPVTFQQQKG